MEESKSVWTSKTLWVNLLAAFALFLQNQFGFALDPGVQALILAGINFILRLVTRKAVSW